MKKYKVEKFNINGTGADYGICSEEDMKLIVSGYSQDKDIPIMYNRKNSHSFFTVEEVE